MISCSTYSMNQPIAIMLHKNISVTIVFFSLCKVVNNASGVRVAERIDI